MDKSDIRFDVLMFSMSSWYAWETKGVTNRNRHILASLGKNKRIGKILSVDFMPYNLKRGLRIFLKDKRFIGGKILKAGLFSRLTQIADDLFIYSTLDSIHNEEIVYRKIRKILYDLEFKNIIVWSYFPMFCGWLDAFDKEIKVFDAVDNWIEHPNFAEYKDRLKKNYQAINQKADLIFCVSKELLKLFLNNKSVHWIPNGVDVEFFQDSKSKTAEGLKNIPKPIIGYCGIIQSRVDMDLIKYLAEKNPDKSIVLVGPVWPDIRKKVVSTYKNIFFLGSKPYNQIPFYLNQFNVGIIPHIVNEFTKSMNPLKLYEYLACGRPVVATPIAGIEEFELLVEVASNKEEFNQKIQKVLQEDNKELSKKRIQTVKKHSWKSRVNQMIKLIEEKC